MAMSEFIVTCGNIVLTAMIVVDVQGATMERAIDMSPLTVRDVTGSTAVLPCRVNPTYTEKLAEQYKVVWVNPSKTAISIQDRRIINDQRISVERPFLWDWNLHIRNVSLTDAGVYKCQLNTIPVGTKNVTLIVKDPPRIIDHSTPLEVQSEEKGKVELFCNATGFPEPDIIWYRLHKGSHGAAERVGDVGNSLVIKNISRNCADSYMCEASNEVEPSTSQTFKVSVLYPPEVSIANSRLGQTVGKDTILECDVTASPLGNVVWMYRNRTLKNDNKHELTLYNNDPTNAVVLSLRIRDIESRDYGIYECKAKNNLGYNRAFMELYELRRKTTTTTTTTTTTQRHTWRAESRNKNLNVYGGNGGGRGSGNGANQGQIWDNQRNRPRPHYSSNEDALRTDVTDEDKANSKGLTGMRSRKGNGRGSSLRDDRGSGSILTSSTLLLILTAILCHATYRAMSR